MLNHFDLRKSLVKIFEKENKNIFFWLKMSRSQKFLLKFFVHFFAEFGTRENH